MSVIGLLDWGIGGMGVLRALRALRPDVSVVYLADSGATPYGKLPRPMLEARVASAIGFLEARGATHVVIGCNAASTVLDGITPKVPVTGMIAPALRAMAGTRGVVGVVGGARTIRSGVYRRGLMSADRTVRQRIAQPLSAHIEAGTTSSRAFTEALAHVVAPLRGADALLLACTHYPAVAGRFAALLEGTRIVDPADAVAHEVVATLDAARGEAHTAVFTTGDATRTAQAAARAFGLECLDVRQTRLR